MEHFLSRGMYSCLGWIPGILGASSNLQEGGRAEVEPEVHDGMQESMAGSFRGRKISDNLYDFRDRVVNRPNATILFIHSLYTDTERLEKAYYNTWLKKGSTDEYWPGTLLADRFPEARILTLKADLAAIRSDNTGRSDLDTMSEDLVNEIIIHGREPIGQEPVILVSHGLGAILALKFILAADKRFRDTEGIDRDKNQNMKLETFRRNVRGLFYYSPIFAGSTELNNLTLALKGTAPALRYAPVLSTQSSREVMEFQKLRRTTPFRENLKTWAVCEQNVTRRDGFGSQVVLEGTSRIAVDEYSTVRTDHIDVCRAEDTTSMNFTFLENFVIDRLEIYPQTA